MGLQTINFDETAEWADLIMLLIPEQDQKAFYHDYLEGKLRPSQILAFAHGFNIHYKEIIPEPYVDVIMIAPKSPGKLVRETYQRGEGVPCLIAVAQDYSGKAQNLALAYADGIGGTRAGVLETNFKDETETDLFGEQAVLCGGVSQLIRYGFETLVENGYPDKLAYFECLHELKLIVDLLYKGGFDLMNRSVSDTAEFGGHLRGAEILQDNVKLEMQKVLQKVQDGSFAKEYLLDARNGQNRLMLYRSESAEHPIEKVGQELRSKMSWLKNEKKVTV
jgi:ketol-acid reductoisomerase